MVVLESFCNSHFIFCSNMARKFLVTDEEIQQVLFADDSGDESALLLDGEDEEFLADDVGNVGVEIDIEPPERTCSEPVKKRRRITVPKTITPEHDVNEGPREEAKSCSFNWKKSYRPKRFTEEAIQYGVVLKPTVEEGTVPTPLEVFASVVDLQSLISDIILPESEKYCTQQGKVFHVSPEEMTAFLGMNLVMSYHVVPAIRDYWSTEPDMGVPYVASVMPRDRFEEIRAALHFADNDVQPERSSSDFDRAFKIRPVMDLLNKSFQEHLSPTRRQSVDEHMIRFKGHNIMKQYVKGKPIRWGFKMWCRCDSETGYLFQFDLYTGKKGANSEMGLGESVVLQLTQSLKGLGCEMYFDNFFNSPRLQNLLSQRDIMACGTVRQNKKNMPKGFPTDKEMKRGDISTFSCDGMSCVKWMDNKAVFMLSNFISPVPTKTALRRSAGTTQKAEIRCPVIVSTYNKWMGGVDLMDQK